MSQETMMEEVEPVETEFSDEELEAMLGVVQNMTKGHYTVPTREETKCLHLIQVNVDKSSPAQDDERGLLCIAALLQWGDDVLEEHMTIQDFTLKTKTKQRLANAATIAWVGNNMHRLLYEVVEMRKKLSELDLIQPRET
jgi:hypothetical protein